MRVRKRKGAEEYLANHPQYVILEPEAAGASGGELLVMTILSIEVRVCKAFIGMAPTNSGYQLHWY